MIATNTCLQINMAPLDIRHALHTLPHQLRVFRSQVSEIQLTLDNVHSRAGRFATDDYESKHAELREYLQSVCAGIPGAYVADIDYSATTVSDVAIRYIGRNELPIKAYDGSPFYAYLYGLHRASSQYVFHIDSDMLFGGGSQVWMAEAIALLEANDEVMACAPLDGPPHPSGFLKSPGAFRNDLQRVSYSWYRLGTRVFMIDKRRFFAGEAKIPIVPIAGYRRWKAKLSNVEPVAMLEDCISKYMTDERLQRVDFLGSGSGLWQLHPPHRSDRFYRELPEIINRIESGEIPDEQRGDHNLNDSMIDWSDARRKLTFWSKLRREVRLTALNAFERVRSSSHL